MSYFNIIILQTILILGLISSPDSSLNKIVYADYFNGNEIAKKLTNDFLVVEGGDLYLLKGNHKLFLNQNINYQMYCFSDGAKYLLQEDINHGQNSKKFGRGFYMLEENIIEINMNGGYDFSCYEFTNNSKLIHFKYDYRKVYEETIFITKNNEICR